jgi:hypothetical protein
MSNIQCFVLNNLHFSFRTYNYDYDHFGRLPEQGIFRASLKSNVWYDKLCAPRPHPRFVAGFGPSHLRRCPHLSTINFPLLLKDFSAHPLTPTP